MTSALRFVFAHYLIVPLVAAAAIVWANVDGVGYFRFSQALSFLVNDVGMAFVLAVQTHDQLLADGIRSRVVSMPSWEIFEQQTPEYRHSVLPPSVMARVAVEQAATFGWERYIGSAGRIIGMKTFGASAPLKALQQKFGFEPDRNAAAAKGLLGKL
jgi:transketolase